MNTKAKFTALFLTSLLISLLCLNIPKINALPRFNENLFRSYLSDLNKCTQALFDPQTGALTENYHQAIQKIDSIEKPKFFPSMRVTSLLNSARKEVNSRLKKLDNLNYIFSRFPHIKPLLEKDSLLTQTESLLLDIFDKLSAINTTLLTPHLEEQDLSNIRGLILLLSETNIDQTTTISQFLLSIIQPLTKDVISKYNLVVSTFNEQFTYQETEQPETEQISIQS